MTREDSIRQIENYPPFNEQEEKDKALILGWIRDNENAFSRKNTVAHITASAWVVNKDRSIIFIIPGPGWEDMRMGRQICCLLLSGK